MGTYIGIDLGTTNSAICSYDGKEITVHRSPEGNTITPSAIYIDGNTRYYGERAYRMAAFAPDKTLLNFKRMIGTSTPIYVPAYDLKLTPEECSAEILRYLYSFLPEDVRNDPETGTVVTIPASFNQMQRDATLTAVELAGIGKVALMQEPVAAVMSIMYHTKLDGLFVVYDLGGGTFDVAIAESIKGRVSLIEHGGIVMCGGRDWDRQIVDEVVIPWLIRNFNLPEGFQFNPLYKTFLRIATWACENAKKELSKKSHARIVVTEDEARMKDESGKSLYIDCVIDRETLNRIIEPQIHRTVEEVRNTLKAANLTPKDINKIVFVGGPSFYQPLREMVCALLELEGETTVDPMLAVAQGAALFAESIDWSTTNKQKKLTKKTLSITDIHLDYLSRTADSKSRILVRCNEDKHKGWTWQIDSRDTGWTSGRMPLKNGSHVEIFLSQMGDNRFSISIYDEVGNRMYFPGSEIIITRTATTVDAIPASNSLCVEVLEKLGSTKTIPKYLVRKGESLPKRGKISFRAMETLKAGSDQSLNFNLYEGEIEDPVSDNNFVGTFKISGKDFDVGVIQKGDELICEYEVSDSGHIFMTVSVPSIGATFTSKNFYSRQEGLIDFTTAEKRLREELNLLSTRINSLSERVFLEDLEKLKDKVNNAFIVLESAKDPETAKLVSEMILETKRALSYLKKTHLYEIRKAELEGLINFYNKFLSPLASPTEVEALKQFYNNALRVISKGTNEFEQQVDQIIDLNLRILWRQDWFIIETFKKITKEEHQFTDKVAFESLKGEGEAYLQAKNIEGLRRVLLQMFKIRVWTNIERELFSIVNIM